LELLDVQGGEGLDPLRAQRRQSQSYDPVIITIASPDDETRAISAIDQFDCAVVS